MTAHSVLGDRQMFFARVTVSIVPPDDETVIGPRLFMVLRLERHTPPVGTPGGRDVLLLGGARHHSNSSASTPPVGVRMIAVLRSIPASRGVAVRSARCPIRSSARSGSRSLFAAS